MTMKNVKTISIALFTLAIYCNPVSAKSTHLSPSHEASLVKICEAIQTNSKRKLRNAIKSSGIPSRAINKGLVCNGLDTVSFALSSGANKTADFLVAKGNTKPFI